MASKYTTDDFIAKSKSLYGNKFDYSKTEYLGSRIKLVIICKKHGKFYQFPTNHFRGYGGCPTCANKLRNRNKQNEAKASFIDKALQVHGNKYDYSKTVYKKRSLEVTITCMLHGDFNQLAGSHLSGCGCYKCGRIYELDRPTRKKDTNQFIREAKRVHGNTYSYSKVKYEHSHKKIEIVCKIHGSFLQSPGLHLRGAGCPICNNNTISYKAISWIEQEAKKLGYKNIQHALNLGEFPIPGTRYRVDGYHHKSKTIFEFYGDDFHGNLKKHKPNSRPHPYSNKTARELYNYTIRREKKLNELGYKVISIWESEYDKK